MKHNNSEESTEQSGPPILNKHKSLTNIAFETYLIQIKKIDEADNVQINLVDDDKKKLRKLLGNSSVNNYESKAESDFITNKLSVKHIVVDEAQRKKRRGCNIL